MRAFVLLLCSGGAFAHGMRSAYLEIDVLDGERATMSLRSSLDTTGLTLVPPAGCSSEGDAALARLTCPGGFAGRAIRVDGIGPLTSEVVVRVVDQDGAHSHLLTADAPEWPWPRNGGAVLGSYVRIGLAHIFTGVDHLLFLVALAMALRRLRAVLWAETAFTASHTLSFTASALGWVHVASAAAEACIALSLVLIALDAATASLRGQPVASLRATAALAFAFGLVHGLGFAGGLAEIGLPDRAIGMALVGFAAGVELGQVIFLLAFVALLMLLSARPRLVLSYAVGCAGAFLLFQRVAILLQGEVR
jgi:hypothetical protein